MRPRWTSPVDPLEEHRELSATQVHNAALCLRPHEATTLQSLAEQTQSIAVPPQKLHSIAAPTPEHEQFIRELYLVEKALWDKDQPIDPEHRVRVRSELSSPIMAKFHAWLEALSPQVLPQSLLGKAVHYTLGQWLKLTTFLTHGEVPLDNNRCENAIRSFVVGRKGWLFSDTVRGAVASANLYSIAETAKANGVEPHAYLSLLFARLPHAKTVEDFEALLPWSVKADLVSATSH